MNRLVIIAGIAFGLSANTYAGSVHPASPDRALLRMGDIVQTFDIDTGFNDGSYGSVVLLRNGQDGGVDVVVVYEGGIQQPAAFYFDNATFNLGTDIPVKVKYVSPGTFSLSGRFYNYATHTQNDKTVLFSINAKKFDHIYVH